MCQNDTVDIDDFAADGRDGNQADTVGCGLGNVIFMLIHLQINKTRHQYPKENQNKDECHHQTQHEIAPSGVVIKNIA